MDKITAEMDELEQMRIKYQYMAKLQELKIQRIKLQQNLEKIDEEEAKVQKHLSKMQGIGEE